MFFSNPFSSQLFFTTFTQQIVPVIVSDVNNSTSNEKQGDGFNAPSIIKIYDSYSLLFFISKLERIPVTWKYIIDTNSLGEN